MILPQGLITAIVDTVRATIRGRITVVESASDSVMKVSAAMVAGQVVVANTRITANTRIFLQRSGADVTHPGHLYVSARVAGTSFTIKSTDNQDVDTVLYLLVEPS